MKKVKKNRKAVYIDLFSGCGGFSLGLHMAGWKGLFAIEKSDDAFLTLKSNLIDGKKHFSWPRWLSKKPQNIKTVLRKQRRKLLTLRGKVDLLAGGPPCQGFSMAGQRNEKDARNKMMHAYIKFVDLIRPKIIFFENVRGFTIKFTKTKKSAPYSEKVINKLRKLGYSVHAEVLNLADYGVPQRRERFILVGVQEGDPKKFFEKIKLNSLSFLKRKGLRRKTPMKAVVSDLLLENGVQDSPDSKGFFSGKYSRPVSNFQVLMRSGVKEECRVANSHRFAKHGKETVSLFEKIMKSDFRNKKINGKKRVEFGLKKRGITLLDASELSPTLTTHPDDFIHYSEPRILTVREYARIQTFPDWYEFKGRYTTGGERRRKEVPRYSQIGNAIPPLFGEQAGIALKEVFLQ